MGERLTAETIDRLRTWTFLGVVVCAGLIVGLSNTVWSNSCPNKTILGGLGIDFGYLGPFCSVTTGTQSHAVLGFGDGRATLILGLALLVTCALGFAMHRSRAMWMVCATLIGLAAIGITGNAASQYWENETITQSLMLLTGASFVATILSGFFVWLDIKYDQATMNGDNQAWA